MQSQSLVGAILSMLLASMLLSGCGGTVGGSPPNGGAGGGGVGMGGAGMGGAPAGAGGRGGAGTSGGTGGADPYCGGIRPTLPMCPGLCGNGVRDTCQATTYGSCPPMQWTETCDGSDVGTDTCRARGFASGSLICSANCGEVTDSGCGECPALDPVLVGCGKAPFDVNPAQLAVAATDTEIGLGWLDVDAQYRVTVSFARLSPALNPVGVTVLDDRVSATPDGRARFYAIAVTTIPAGWLVAVLGPSEVSVRAVGPDGAETGRAVVDTEGVGDFLGYPKLAARPTGGPLLVWTKLTGESTAVIRAAVIGADGRSATAPVDLVTADLVNLSLPSAAFLDGGFHVGYSLEEPVGAFSFRFTHVGVDGKVAGVVDALPGEAVWGPILTAGANDLRAVYFGSLDGTPQGEPAILWRRFDSGGHPLVPAVPVGDDVPTMLGPGHSFGDDTVFVALSSDDATLGFARVALDGRVVASHEIARSRFIRDTGYVATRRGPDVVVAWKGERGFQMARVRP